MKKVLHDQRGQVLIIAPFLFIILLLLLGLVVDTSYFVYSKWKMQNAVDLAALAGAENLIKNPGSVVLSVMDFGEQNGLNRDDLNIITTDQTVQVEATNSIQFFFMPLFGIQSKDITVSATAEVANLPSPIFQYGIFSANPSQDFKIPGSDSIIDGKTHINGNLNLPGSNNHFNQTCEVAGTVKANMTKNSFLIMVNPATVLLLPQFNINYYKIHASQTYAGNQSFSNIKLQGIIFVDGDVSISGDNVSGNGTIIATGSISIASSNLKYSSGNDLVGFYALKNITLPGSNGNIDGYFYAPNGMIKIPGSGNTFYGSLIAQSFEISGFANHYKFDPRVTSVALPYSIRLIR